MSRLSLTEIAAIKQRLPTYPIEAQADIEKLLKAYSEKRAPTPKKDVPYSPEYETVCKDYRRLSRKCDKQAGWQCLQKRVSEGYSHDDLIGALCVYLQEQERKQTGPAYYLNLSTFFGPQKRFADYIEQITDITLEPDYWEPAQMLIRDMSPQQRAIHGVPYPLPPNISVFLKGLNGC